MHDRRLVTVMARSPNGHTGIHGLQPKPSRPGAALAAAPPPLSGVQPSQAPWPMHGEEALGAGEEQLVQRLRAELARAVAERDGARAWARAEYHQMWDAPYLPDKAPGWLTAPI